MILVIKNDKKNQMDKLIKWIAGQGLDIHMSEGANTTVVGLIGDTSKIDIDLISSLEIVESVKRISEPYKKANRKFHPNDTVVSVAADRDSPQTGNAAAKKPVQIGGKAFTFIAGPCSVESRDQIVGIALAVKKSGASILRGGAFKPRTSPYAFQGLGEEGVKLLIEAKKESGLPIVTEIMNAGQLPLFQDVDIIQIGARNMQNFDLLKEVGRSKKPILLKRGLANTVEEWLMSAEYIMSKGNENVVLCERGIRTFEPLTRNTLDLSAIPLIKELTHLPVIADPSHASGLSRLVLPLSMAAAAAGSDGLMIEVHNDPTNALCDGAQSIRPEQFDEVARKVGAVLAAIGRERG
ncbi:MAG: 3-deoxy-7-phosphoheptulonate synthase [Clostridiales bacterium]|jgi:3-deoxy-7-phosphoheptulonate synthase|nr:3-deoxy-7-phosphoheptulonate synthase [Clostridiales bacterium]